MSYTVFIQKFENGDSANFTFDALEIILTKYGKIVMGNYGLEFVSDVGELFESASLSGSVDDGISGITFHRPLANKIFPELIFDLLSIKNTCFFGTDVEFVNSRNEMKHHYPVSLIENLPNGPKVISHALDNWEL